MAKYTGVYLNQDEGNKWTASYWIAAVSKWVHYTILGDKDGNLIDSAHPLDVKAAANSGVDIGDVDVLSSALPTGAATSAKQDTLAGLVGEVQESPTENTVLERLKALETELTDIKSTSGIKGITDTVNVAVTGSLPSAFESVTVDDTADILTAATYGTSKRALLTVETAQIRFRLDGTAPTSSVGHIANAGDQIVLASNGDIANFKAIRTTSTSATLRCSYSS